MEPLEGTECAGVDLNRNFDSHWHEEVCPLGVVWCVCFWSVQGNMS